MSDSSSAKITKVAYNIQHSCGKNIVNWSADNSNFGNKMIGLIHKEYLTDA